MPISALCWPHLSFGTDVWAHSTRGSIFGSQRRAGYSQPDSSIFSLHTALYAGANEVRDGTTACPGVKAAHAGRRSACAAPRAGEGAAHASLWAVQKSAFSSSLGCLYITLFVSQRGNFQAPRASHSLHVGSFQENRSYVTTLWRRKSSDQGNCRLQAPSTPQSVHVGSSQGKRTCKLGLYLPSSDQEMHVLYLGIQYVVEGRWKEFWSGWASLETSLSNERKILTSVYPCGSRNGAHASSLAQDECKTDDTGKFHFLHGVNIVIERAQADVHSWIDNKYAYWQNGKRKSSWWDHIRDEFIQIFRNVMVCLRHIYSKRIYSDGILVINNRETKLILFVKAATEEEFNNGSRRDIIDLRQLMVEAVLKDYIECNAWDRTKEQAAIYFSKERLPNDLCHFIGRLYDENFVPINLDWLLNDPAFWSPDLKLGFFRVLYEIVHDQQLMYTGYASKFVSARLEEMKIANWECLIPHEGPEREVLNKMRHDQKRYNKNKFTKRDAFFDILLFCRHCIEHYNDKLPHHERKQKEEISLIVDKTFQGGCSILWNSILEAWMDQPSSSKTERPEYMNRLMTVGN